MAGLRDDTKDGLLRAARLIGSAEYLVALAGAGLSVESGIPPFRGLGGLWTKYGEPSMLSYQEFMQDPQLWWETRLREEAEPGKAVYEMKAAVDQARPNPGHYALVNLERRGMLKRTITQNVDNLHAEAGSQGLLEIHGNRTLLRCLECAGRILRAGSLMGDLPPRCPECGGPMKMDTVMFGEPIPAGVLQACQEEVARCDCMLLVGTSGSVNPAAQLPLAALQRGASLIEINPLETALTPFCQVALTGPAGELLPLLLEQLGDRQSLSP